MSRQEERLRAEAIRGFPSRGRPVLPVGPENRRALAVAQIRTQHRVAQVFEQAAIEYRAQCLDTPIEISFHEVGAADEGLRFAAVIERVDA